MSICRLSLAGIAKCSVLALALFGLSMTAPAFQAQDGADAVAKTRDAMAEYKRGNYQNAISKLDDVLASKPSEQEAKRIRDEVTLELAQEFIQNHLADPALRGRLRAIGQWMVMGRVGASIHSRIPDDPAGVARFVAEYMSETNPILRMQRGQVLRDKYGEFAVPEIHEKYMAHEQNADTRARARGLLATLGTQAVMPLIQIMQSGNALDRENAALALGDIASGIALPVLQQYYEDASQPQAVRDACARSLSRILYEDQPRIADAASLWLLQAEAYYRNEAAGGYSVPFNRLIGSTYPGHLPTLVDVHDRTYTVWRWSPELRDGAGGLFFEEVPMWNYSDVLAEECALNAMNLALAGADKRGFRSADEDPLAVQTMALLACISVRQYNNGQMRLANGVMEERDFIRNMIGEWGIPRTKHLKGYAASMGPRVLYAAVDRSLKDGYPYVTVGLCNILGDLDGTDVYSSSGSRPAADDVRPPRGRESGGIGDDERGSRDTRDSGRDRERDADRDRAAARDRERTTDRDGERATDRDRDSRRDRDRDSDRDPDSGRPTRNEARPPVRQDNFPMYQPVVRALDHPDRRIRYAAARALVKLGRLSDFGANEGAQGVFGNSLAETATRTVLVIAENDQIRQRYAAVLEDQGFGVVTYDKLEEGLKQAQLAPIVDAIILEAAVAAKPTFYWAPTPSGLGENSTERKNELPVNMLQEDVRTRTIPLLLACPEGEIDTYKTRFEKQRAESDTFTDESFLPFGSNVNVEPSALVDTLNGFFLRTAESRQFSTNEFIVEAARVLLALDPNRTSYNSDRFLEQLGQSIGQPSGRTSEAKIAIAQSIAHMASFEALDAGVGATILTQLIKLVISDQGVDTPAVKGAAAKAIGEIFHHHPGLYAGALGDDAYNALKASMRLQFDVTGLSRPEDAQLRQNILDDVENARNAAGVALGQMPLAFERRAEHLREQRASRHIPLAAQGSLQANRFAKTGGAGDGEEAE